MGRGPWTGRQQMKILFAVMLGGALGSGLRYGISLWIATRVGEEFPWGTVTVNVIGSFVIALFLGLTGPEGALTVSPVARSFVAIGILGGFTTFSSFSWQTLQLLQDGQWFWAAGNVLLSVIACLLAAAAGLALAHGLPLRS